MAPTPTAQQHLGQILATDNVQILHQSFGHLTPGWIVVNYPLLPPKTPPQRKLARHQTRNLFIPFLGFSIVPFLGSDNSQPKLLHFVTGILMESCYWGLDGSTEVIRSAVRQKNPTVTHRHFSAIYITDRIHIWYMVYLATFTIKVNFKCK